MRAEEILTKAANASQTVETATFTQDITMDLGSQESMEIEANGAMDRDAEKMRMESELDRSGESTPTTTYHIGDTTYIDNGGVWVQQENAQSFWKSQYDSQNGSLESATDVEVVETTTTNGHEVYVLEVVVDKDKTSEPTTQQTPVEGTGETYGILKFDYIKKLTISTLSRI